ncbi:tetratricopeptide repeat protein [Propionivibrio dicarboxylicus]|uniref:Tetratricopeptide repeat-containing protein n=1 Tax=Propionivibrio dicarboxylicus TaxID=83767 RepID=A0A1G7ZFS9_9RHOO|nr:tetratricopeptide repeat protein [Propionivibrio dicarboxylicus]SDH07601.1 Tetratricopeptide repeat-containing protein [Propionivibrio dicarboxylicus]
MKRFMLALLLLATVSLGLPAFAAEPTLHEVYQTANNGRVDDARAMMREVLAAHPNSGKAHYVNAELLARQGELKQAADELATAEKLAPGLPFASPESVSGLKNAVHRTPTAHAASPLAGAPSAAAGIPWGLLAGGLGLVAFIAWAARFMTRRNATAPNDYGASARTGTVYPAPTPAPYGTAGTPAYGNAAPAASAPGFGSQMLGGLATGVAVGAGVAAGEALMHRVLDGHRNSSSGFSDLGPSGFGDDRVNTDSSAFDMGGDDFGISDTASWDDGGSSGDSDWN